MNSVYFAYSGLLHDPCHIMTWGNGASALFTDLGFSPSPHYENTDCRTLIFRKCTGGFSNQIKAQVQCQVANNEHQISAWFQF